MLTEIPGFLKCVFKHDRPIGLVADFTAVTQPGFSFGWGTTQLSFHSFPTRPPHPPFLPFTLSIPLSHPFVLPSFTHALPCHLSPAARGPLGSAVSSPSGSGRSPATKHCMVHSALTSQPLIGLTFVFKNFCYSETHQKNIFGPILENFEVNMT